MEQKDRSLMKTAAAMFVLLLFFFAQGAIVVITGIEGVPSAMIRGAVIWSLVAVTLAYYRIRYKGISKLGFHGMKKGAAKRMLYFSPLLLIALSHFTAGMDLKGGVAYLFSYLFLTLGIGMAEEIFSGHYLRLMAKTWYDKGNDTILRPFRIEPSFKPSGWRGAWGNDPPDLFCAGLRNGIRLDFRRRTQPSPLCIAPRPARLLRLHQWGVFREI